MPIAVELSQVYGVQKAALTSGELIDKSGKAFDEAMNTIREVAEKVTLTMDPIAARPDDMEISFAIKLTAEAGAVIAKTGIEGTFSVKLAWKKSG